VSISSGSTDTLTFAVVNDPSNTLSLNRVDIFIPSTPSGFVYQSASGSNSVTAGWSVSFSVPLQRIRFTSTGTLIDPGDVGEFQVIFSQTPTVTSDTEANFVIDLRKSTAPTLVESLSVTLLITASDLALTAAPQSGIPADGISSSTISATLTSGGSPLAGKTINFSTTNGTLSSMTSTTDSSGMATVALTAPTSTVDTSAVVTATYLATSGTVTVSFTGVTSPNIIYVGGTLSPTSATRSQSGVSFSVKVNNTGGTGVTLSTASTFSFTDGTTIYTSTLSSSVVVGAGATNVTLSFSAADVSVAFNPGFYNPTLSLTDGAGYNQTVPVSDTVQVKAPNLNIVMAVDKTGATLVLPDDPGNPGEATSTLTYTITYTNSSSSTAAAATSVVIKNKVPSNTDYKPGSITLDEDIGGGPGAVGLTDTADADKGDYDTPSETVTVNVGTVGIGITGQITFQVVVE